MTANNICINLPEEFTAAFQAKGVFILSVNNFITVYDSSTKWINENDFIFSGLMSVLSLFIQGVFKKIPMFFLEKFKKSVESV